MKEKLLEKLEQFLLDLNLDSVEITQVPIDPDEAPQQGKIPDLTPATAHAVSENKQSPHVASIIILTLVMYVSIS